MAAKNFTASVGYDQTTGLVPTYYLDKDGLTAFWAKVKDYVNFQDVKLREAVKTKIDNNDAAIRSYIESLEINGLGVNSNKAEGTLGTKLTITVDGGAITVLGAKNNKEETQTPAAEKDWVVNGDWDANKTARHNSYSDGVFTVEEALANVDARLDAVQGELLNGVVSGLNVTTKHGTYTKGTEATTDDVANKEWVKVTGSAVATSPQTGKLTIDIDDTEINSKFNGIDSKLIDLEANAGVTDIKVTDVDHTTTNNRGMVGITLKGTKTTDGSTLPTPLSAVEGELRRGEIEIILDESALDEKLDGIDSKINALVSATKFAGTVSWNPETVTITKVTSSAELEDYKITGTGLPTEGIIMQSGDIVIVSGTSKEYILDGAQGKFVELGDTTAEQARLSAIEFWVDNNMITTPMINNLQLGDTPGDAWAATPIAAL